MLLNLNISEIHHNLIESGQGLYSDTKASAILEESRAYRVFDLIAENFKFRNTLHYLIKS